MILKVKALRESKGLTQEKLAEIAGVSRVTLSHIESGEDVSVTSGTLLAIAKALGTTIDGIVFYNENV